MGVAVVVSPTGPRRVPASRDWGDRARSRRRLPARRLARDVDLVVVESRGSAEERVLPAGRLREPVEAVSRGRRAARHRRRAWCRAPPARLGSRGLRGAARARRATHARRGERSRWVPAAARCWRCGNRSPTLFADLTPSASPSCRWRADHHVFTSADGRLMPMRRRDCGWRVRADDSQGCGARIPGDCRRHGRRALESRSSPESRLVAGRARVSIQRATRPQGSGSVVDDRAEIPRRRSAVAPWLPCPVAAQGNRPPHRRRLGLVFYAMTEARRLTEANLVVAFPIATVANCASPDGCSSISGRLLVESSGSRRWSPMR